MSDTGNWPTVTVVVLNWNGREVIFDTLLSLRALDYPNSELIFVDNASTDGSVEAVQERFPGIRTIVNPANLGFSGGINMALREVTTTYVALVNPDVIVPPDWLTQMISLMEREPATAVAGCKVIYPDGRTIQHAGGAIALPRAIPGHIGHGEEDMCQYDLISQAEYVTGAAVVIRKDVLDKIGLFDEGYFLYFEEVDLCLRARRAGYSVVYNGEVKVTHSESALAEKWSPTYLLYVHESRWRFLLKQHDTKFVLSETVPAEKEWLTAASEEERAAADHAYRSALMALREIRAYRQEYGEGFTSGDEGQWEDSVTRALLELRRHARRNSLFDRQTARMRGTSNGEIMSIPFRSKVPVIGPLIAWFRRQWHRVAGRAYVDVLVEQQSAYNALTFDELDDLSEQIIRSDEKILANDQLLASARQNAAALAEQVVQLARRTDAIKRG